MWQLAVDTGGTFTDCLALPPSSDGRPEQRFKLLSSGRLSGSVVCVEDDGSLILASGWGGDLTCLCGFQAHWSRSGTSGHTTLGRVLEWSCRSHRLRTDEPSTEVRPGDTIHLSTGEPAPVVAARLATGTAPGCEFPPLRFRLATTRGTNALLERKVARVAVFLNEGLGDLLKIRDQRRPDLFARNIVRPAPLAEQVIETSARLDAKGGILEQPDWTSIEAQIAELRRTGVEAVAAAFLHSDLNPIHEQELRTRAESSGFRFVSLSSAMATQPKLLPRAETAVVDAALGPVMADFIDEVRVPLGKAVDLQLMTSAGMLVPADLFRPKDGLLSGPAGGVAGAVSAAKRVGRPRAIAFDMGGTSTDVARLDHGGRLDFEHAVADGKVLAPALRIRTVAAGGGSICRLANAGLVVGPESAGAHPGPACYGQGGPLTVTDVNLLLGRVSPERMGIPIDLVAAETAFEKLRAEVAGREGSQPDRRALLQGLLAVAVQHMADAIRKITVAEGAAPEDHLLIAFGGAGPQHACLVAEQLGITEVLVPSGAGILSALGLARSRLERLAEVAIARPLLQLTSEWAETVRRLEKEAIARLAEAGVSEGDAEIGIAVAELRLLGQESSLPIEFDRESDVERLATRFRDGYREIYGLPPSPKEVIEVVSLRVSARHRSRGKDHPVEPCWKPEEPINGQIPDDHCTIIAPLGWNAERSSASGDVLLSFQPSAKETGPSEFAVAEVQAELFRGRFQSLVDEMGAQLQRTAFSPNVRERLDYSCALLDSSGRLIASAPHVPVHLGALGECVRRVAAALPLRPGDVAVTNHPAFGGSHLPDVTVITPLHNGDGILFAYVANRAHHAEIGGITPGSMPAGATLLEEEGVALPPILVERDGTPDFTVFEAALREARWPSRDPDSNLSDLRGQIAANRLGARSFAELLARWGGEGISHHFQEQLDRSGAALRRALVGRPLNSGRFEDTLDDGHALAVAIEPGCPLRIDFTGTGGPHPANFNATPAIVQSALLYCLRLLLDEELPLNEGLLDEVELILPHGSFLNPKFTADPARCPAVVAGNVETSQRIVNLLLRAFGILAGGQGTMNNFLFGSERFGYYETIGGGAGAGCGFDGASGVHVHMTNTAITDPEVLERRFPVRLRQFQIRSGSGGLGKWSGGDGLIREIEFLAPLSVSILSQHRNSGPQGLAGGRAGTPGEQWLLQGGEEDLLLPGCVSLNVEAGDRIRIETPGGGGYGVAKNEAPPVR